MGEHTTNKPCVKCGCTDRYPAPPNRKIGQCINCQKRRYQKNKDHIIENVAIWQKQNRAKVLTAKRKWKETNPEKKDAHNKVMYAIRKGTLLPANQCDCFDCGTKATAYHHEDYSKPLEVVPLCVVCHNKRHVNQK